MSEPESFEALCRREQQSLDQNLADVEFLSLRQSYGQAAMRFGEFRRHLEDHLLAEERVMLPLFIERCGGDPHGIALKIRHDHARLQVLVDSIAAAISQWDRPTFSERLADLRAALKVHHDDEEARLHVALGLLTAAQWRQLCFSAGVSA